MKKKFKKILKFILLKLFNFFLSILKIFTMKFNLGFGDWGLGIWDWGMGIGDWVRYLYSIT